MLAEPVPVTSATLSVHVGTFREARDARASCAASRPPAVTRPRAGAFPRGGGALAEGGVRWRHDAGWSSSVARWAHNPEVAGSNPVPATANEARCDCAPGLVV